MAGLTRALVAAEAAMEWANATLRGRSANRSEDIAHGAQQVLKASGRALTATPAGPQRQQLFQRAYDHAEHQHERWLEQARAKRGRLTAARVLRNHIGNCQEHTILVCHYIATHHPGVTAHFIGLQTPSDHSFALVGAERELPKGRGALTLTFPDPPSELGALAVVADAWWHEVFPARSGVWTQKLGHILRQTRLDPSQDLPDAIKADCFLLT